MIKSVLMIAFHFPPVSGSSGLLRTLKFSNFLVDHGWHPTVLSVAPMAYEQTRDDQLADIDENVSVIRSWAADAARHFSVAGKYPSGLARPDRWGNWWISGVLNGVNYVRHHRPALIWSTYPIATAHSIAATIARLTGVPWVADFRDMMVDEFTPVDRITRKRYLKLEEKVVNRSSKVVFTTPGTLQLYSDRYPELPDSHWACIRNGFDEADFEKLGVRVETETSLSVSTSRQLKLIHSGVLYPIERDPSKFFEAIAILKENGVLSGDVLQVVLRATGHDVVHEELIRKYSVADIVKLKCSISYRDALAEMSDADGLLIFQASNCNHQVPAKLYEYFASRRPIFALTDKSGDTAGVMRELGYQDIAAIDDASEIAECLGKFIARIRKHPLVDVGVDQLRQYSRRCQTEQLVEIFEKVAYSQ